MKVPRDVSGEELAKRLNALGYRNTRQTGLHIRLTHLAAKTHHITIPAHKTLAVGTLNNILKDVAAHLELDRDELIRRLWP